MISPPPHSTILGYTSRLLLGLHPPGGPPSLKRHSRLPIYFQQGFNLSPHCPFPPLSEFSSSPQYCTVIDELPCCIEYPNVGHSLSHWCWSNTLLQFLERAFQLCFWSIAGEAYRKTVMLLLICLHMLLRPGINGRPGSLVVRIMAIRQP